MLIYALCHKCYLSEIGKRPFFAVDKTEKEHGNSFDEMWNKGFSRCFGRGNGSFHMLLNRNSEPPYSCPYILEYTVNKSC